MDDAEDEPDIFDFEVIDCPQWVNLEKEDYKTRYFLAQFMLKKMLDIDKNESIV